MSDLVSVAVEDRLAVITLNRPEAYNAFNEALMCPFLEEVTRLATDDSVQAVVVTGAGKAFCAGGDLKTILANPDGTRSMLHRLAAKFHSAVVEMRRMPKPVIAAINGVAAGGGFSLALSADFRVMARSATLKCAYGSAGLCMDGGGTWTLPRLVGTHRALEIAAFDEAIQAERALEWGLVTKLVDDGQALAEATAMARHLMGRSIHAYGWAKKLVLQSFDTPLEIQLEDEREGIATCGAHPDGIEGMTAFAEKRKPRFGV